ncbi:hypothetical protein [Methanobrevibacter sp.]|uniref:hypothetical protein n=1 Tax=Methanobrevibacter sp. TaxID=66852 RepID=UPI0026E02161|nr:hypothetical protein [Methanobrevibacter sp.]MDO5859648.1 hypothetical protein [Methanobrevibacter sp.]
MDTFDKIKKSWWVLFPFTIAFPGFGFIYIGVKSSNKNWMLEGITYELPFFLYVVASSAFPSGVMANYYLWIIALAMFIALIRSVMVAIKLFDVYDLDETPKITTVNRTNASSSDSGNGTSRASNAVNKVKNKDSNWKECCCCVIAIFIIFAIISVL